MIHVIMVGQRKFFQEFVDAMILALMAKGYNEIRSIFYLRKGLESGAQRINFSKDLNIICTPQNIEERYILPGNGSECVWIQTEQIPKPTSYDKWSRVLTLFKDLETTNRTFFPCGYSNAFVGKKMIKTKTHNLFSFGAATPYRTRFAKRLRIYHQRVCSGEERNSLIRRADINVNIKAFDRPYFFAPLHALHVICNEKILFQQRSYGDWSLYKPYIIQFRNKKAFDDLKTHWLQDKPRLVAYGKEMKEKLMKELDFNEQFHYCLKGVI